MLLVTGATGTTGSEVLRALKDRERPRRARSCATRRRRTTCATHGFEPVTGDLGDPRTLASGARGRGAGVPRLAGRADAVRARADVHRDRQGGGRRAHRQALGDRGEPGGAAAVRPLPRHGRAGAQAVRHRLDAAAPDGVHAEHAGLGPAGPRRNVLRAGAGRRRLHRRRPRRGRGGRRRADRHGPRGQVLRPERPRGRLLPRPGAARCSPSRGARSRSRRCRWRTSSASSCASACRRGTPRG